MYRARNHKALVLFIALFALLAAPIEARKKKPGSEVSDVETDKLGKRELTDEQLADLVRQYEANVRAERESLQRTAVRRLAREYESHQATGVPFVRDILVLSGGGAKGAFGAGFLEAWGRIPPGPMSRPEFDVVTGVSTGALIAPYAFVGTDETYAEVAEFYGEPESNLTKRRGGLFFLPTNVSLFKNNGLRRYIHGKIDDGLVKAVADGAEEDRILLVGATNLDLGKGRVFDLGQAAINAQTTESRERIHAMLLASSAIPAAFPPIELDGFYYADGGISSQIFVIDQLGDTLARWSNEHPAAPLPRVRLWVILHEQLRLDPRLTRPRWTSIVVRSLSTMMRASMLTSLNEIKQIAFEAEAQLGVDVEFRYVAIPGGASRRRSAGLFEPEYMAELRQLGLEMGADPNNWQNEIPAIQWPGME